MVNGRFDTYLGMYAVNRRSGIAITMKPCSELTKVTSCGRAFLIEQSEDDPSGGLIAHAHVELDAESLLGTRYNKLLRT
jgi:hypothetical protein